MIAIAPDIRKSAASSSAMILELFFIPFHLYSLFQRPVKGLISADQKSSVLSSRNQTTTAYITAAASTRARSPNAMLPHETCLCFTLRMGRAWSV